MELEATTFRSQRLGNERSLWVQPPAAGGEAAICLTLLDAEYYIERIQAPKLLDSLQASGALPPMTVVYVSHLDGETRWPESFCNPNFAGFLAEELTPWAHSELPTTATQYFLGGLSLTGLAAAHAALSHPDAFTGVLCQSASFWWAEGRLIDEVNAGVFASPTSDQGAHPVCRISCGSQELQEYVEHGADLIQRSSQLASNQAMANALRNQGYEVSFEEFEGGHDIDSWKIDLPKSIASLVLSPRATQATQGITAHDAEFLRAFENCTLPADEWNHRAHVRVAYLYALQHRFDVALEAMRVSLKTYNKSQSVPEAIDRGYHETITRAFMIVISAACQQGPRCASSDDFCEQHTELLDKRALLQYYSRDRIMSWEAKRDFISPDLAALPTLIDDDLDSA